MKISVLFSIEISMIDTFTIVDKSYFALKNAGVKTLSKAYIFTLWLHVSVDACAEYVNFYRYIVFSEKKP